MSVYLLNSEIETKQFAEQIAQYCPENKRFIVFLNGELGSGKTTFARFFISALGHSGLVKSPTYIFVKIYPLPKHTVFHLDLYRLRFPAEVLEIGLYDEFEQASVWLIEWSERALSFLPVPDIVCTFTVLAAHRQVAFQSQTPSGYELLQKFYACQD
jgi:tRNA threonylcarbamoyladenosine biosynthesis protein TsaE